MVVEGLSHPSKSMTLLLESNGELNENIDLLVYHFSVRHSHKSQNVAIEKLSADLEHVLLDFSVFIFDQAVLRDLDMVSYVNQHVYEESAVRFRSSNSSDTNSLLHNLHEWFQFAIVEDDFIVDKDL